MALPQYGAMLAAPALAKPGAVDAGDTRTRVRALIARERAGGPRLTGKHATAVGIKPRRAQELRRELRGEASTTQPSEQRLSSPDVGAP